MTQRPSTPPRTPHGPINELLTGDFDMASGYSTWRSSGTDDYLIILTLAGLGRFGGTQGKEYSAQPYDIMLIEPRRFHDYATHGRRWKFLWAHFHPRPDWLDLLDWPQPDPGLHQLSITHAAAQRDVLKQFNAVHLQAQGTGPLRLRRAMNALERLLLTCAEQNPQRNAQGFDPRIRQVMDHVGRNLSRPLTLDVLAEVAGLSVSRLGHRFRQIVGCGPIEFVERMRIDRAKALLTMTSFSVKEVAAQVGYVGQFYFSLRFKKRTGQNPTAFRASQMVHPPSSIN